MLGQRIAMGKNKREPKGATYSVEDSMSPARVGRHQGPLPGIDVATDRQAKAASEKKTRRSVSPKLFVDASSIKTLQIHPSISLYDGDTSGHQELHTKIDQSLVFNIPFTEELRPRSRAEAVFFVAIAIDSALQRSIECLVKVRSQEERRLWIREFAEAILDERLPRHPRPVAFAMMVMQELERRGLPELPSNNGDRREAVKWAETVLKLTARRRGHFGWVQSDEFVRFLGRWWESHTGRLPPATRALSRSSAGNAPTHFFDFMENARLVAGLPGTDFDRRIRRIVGRLHARSSVK